MTVTPADLAHLHAVRTGRFGRPLHTTLAMQAQITVRPGNASRQARILRRAVRTR